MGLAVITIGIAPEFQLGPITIAWHGLTIAIGILVGGFVAWQWAKAQGMDPEPLTNIAGLLALGGLIGGRIFYLLERDPGGLLEPGTLFSNRGFTFDGGLILAAILIGVYLWRTGLGMRYLDAVAVGLPLGVAVGRIGDIINGEHYGARSDFFLAVRNSNPDALSPDPTLAFQNGGLYETLLGLVIFAVVWPLRNRLTHPGSLAWLVFALFAVGRFFTFFLRTDTPVLSGGLSNGQWTSVVLLIAAGAGWAITVAMHNRSRR